MSLSDDALVTSLPPEMLTRNGVPDARTAQRRERAAALVNRALQARLRPSGLRMSPLGPAWSADIDAHVTTMPTLDELRAHGWLCLDDLLRRLGRTTAGRWAVVEDGTVLGALDLTLDPLPERGVLEQILQRCRRRGEVRLREILELRTLVQHGTAAPDDLVMRAAAAGEAALGGAALAAWRAGPPALPPVPVRDGRARARGVARRVRAVVRPRRRVLVAISGVDGAGKSTLARGVTAALAAGGVPAAVVWTRPGMRLGRMEAAARAVKRLLRNEAEPALRAVAADEDAAPRSRRGVLGTAWLLVIVTSYLRDVRRRLRLCDGVAVLDRHLLDAVATLRVFYAGVPGLRCAEWLVARGLPAADVTVYVGVPADVAAARKPGDTIGVSAIRRQLDGYDALLANRRDVTRLDGTRPPDELALAVLRLVMGEGSA